MTRRNKLSHRARRRGGMVIVYLSVCMVVLVALMGLAVDMGRVQAAKSELRRAADSAARAGASALLDGGGWTNTGGFTDTTDAVSAVVAVMNNSTVDGQVMDSTKFNVDDVSTNSGDLQIGNWNFQTQTFVAGGSPTNAVQVWARRITPNSDPIPLLFTAVLGISTDDVYCSSIAAVANLTDGNPNDGPNNNSNNGVAPQTVMGRYNPYLAGAPPFDPTDPQKGTYASAPELPTEDFNQDDKLQQTTVNKLPVETDEIYQDDASEADAIAHPLEYDMAGPVGGNITGPNNAKGDPTYTTINPLTSLPDTSESPLEVETGSGADIPLQAGEVIQISAPLPTSGSTLNEVVNSNNPVTTDANGYVDGNAPTTSEIYEDVGAIPTNDAGAMQQYAAYNNDPQANNTWDATKDSIGNKSSAETTNLLTSSGDDDVIQGSENNLSNVAAPLNSMMGVFLPPVPTDGNTAPQPLGTKAPPGYDFTNETARNYDQIGPSVQQVFYTGSGQTNNGVRGAQQSIVVPANAGRFYLGTMDGQEWANNTGAFTGITINVFQVDLVQ